MTERKKFEDNQPGMDQKRDVPNEDYLQTRKSTETQEQGRTSFNAGSTVQGGSNYGQGSIQLGGSSYNQGNQKNAGSNYDTDTTADYRSGTPAEREPVEPDEKGKFTEARDDIPHGQGAHVNEKESNAQEDYPGTAESKKDDEPERDII